MVVRLALTLAALVFGLRLIAGSPPAYGATFTVTKVADTNDGVCDSDCSLREAIIAANLTAAEDTISFDIQGAGPHVIQVEEAPPALTFPLTIDGTTNPDYVNVPTVHLDGSLLVSAAAGLQIEGGDSRVEGLAILNFGGNGITITGAGGNEINKMYIGLDPSSPGTGTGNGQSGIRVETADNIVGDAIGDAVIVANNLKHGIEITGAGATNNAVRYARIGTDASTSADYGNALDGVLIGAGATGNVIGGTVADVMIGNNGRHGVSITGTGASGNTLVAARIGVGDSDSDHGNGGSGVSISNGAGDNTIGEAGGSSVVNVISFNQRGVVIQGSTTSGNVVQNSRIGTNTLATADLGNTLEGVRIDQSPGNTIGGSGDLLSNVISGNGDGVVIFGSNATGNVVRNNRIGTNATATAVIPNDDDGVVIDGAPGNTVGGTGAADFNTISGNGGDGVQISGAGATGNLITQNLIGATPAFGVAMPNGANGVRIFGASGNTVGSSDGTLLNTIAFNVGDGVRVEVGTGNTIRNNRIFLNGGLGINNLNGGNEELAPPVITGYGSVSGAACAGCTVDIYGDFFDQGFVANPALTTVADGAGNWTVFSEGIGPNVVALATNPGGSTSEFSAPSGDCPDSDGDGLCDAGETCALVADCDGDGFDDRIELFAGTDRNVACPATTTANDELIDAWPPDLDDNRSVNILDIFFLTPPVFNKTAQQFGYDMRRDLDASGAINILDVLKLTPPVFNTTCTP